MVHTMLLAALLSTGVAAAPTPAQDQKTPTVESSDVLAPLRIVPVRKLRPMSVAVEAGINGLTGLGLQLGYNVHPHFALDLAGGLSGQTGRVGLRARYNLLKDNLTPFVGLGVLYGFGTPRALTDTDRGNKIAYKIDRSPMAQASAGLSWTTRKGFTLLASAGWVQLLRNDNVLIKSGTPNERQRRALKYAAGSGPSASLAVGYAF